MDVDEALKYNKYWKEVADGSHLPPGMSAEDYARYQLALKRLEETDALKKVDYDQVLDLHKHVDDWLKEIDTEKTKPNQVHHYASNKNSTYTEQFKEIADKYGLDLDWDWNKDYLPHIGRHPNDYHDLVLQQMKNADEIAQGNKQVFLDLFEENVKVPVINNPNILYKDYWINLLK